MNKDLENLRKNYDSIADEYMRQLLDLWSNHDKKDPYFSPHYGWWVNNDRTGVYCYGDDIFIDLPTAIYCVENEIMFKEFSEWQEYNTDMMSFGLDTVSLPSWHEGAPRISKRELDNMKKMRQDLDDYVEMVKNGQTTKC